MTEISKVGRNVLEIRGPELILSTELNALQSMDPEYLKDVQEVRWISSSKIVIDEDVQGEFWSGKNIVMHGQEIVVSGTERILDVSGMPGVSADSLPPPTPAKPGLAGLKGEDGKPGKCGGNIVIKTVIVISYDSSTLLLVSNGGNGGGGQPGGRGSDGLHGLNGDDRYSMSHEQLTNLFPFPGKGTAATEKGLESLRHLVSTHGGQVTYLPVEDKGSNCWELETRERASFRFAFYSGKYKSFYMVFTGAPGTRGQPGGRGGGGGRGGHAGDAGAITVKAQDKHNVVVRRRQDDGVTGRDGQGGESGGKGVDGKQGTDYAYIEQFPGLFNFKVPDMTFQGNLRMLEVKPENAMAEWLVKNYRPIPTMFKVTPLDRSAFCPTQKKFISFEQSAEVRPTLKRCDVQAKKEDLEEKHINDVGAKAKEKEGLGDIFNE